VRVTTDGLRVRSLPGVSNESKKLEPLLWNGEVAFVIDGPVTASGYDWYQIRPLGEVDLQYHPDPPALGWVAAAGKDGEPWLAPYPVECQPTPLDWLAIDGFEYPPSDLVALGCFGSATQRFQAWLQPVEGGCGPGPRWAIEPAWMDQCREPAYGISDPSDGAASEVPWLAVAIDPAVDLAALPPLGPGEAVLVDIQGRYDHPAARACQSVRTGSPDDPQPPAELVILGCRVQFVATAIDIHVDG
jgi:hypothetical protein